MSQYQSDLPPGMVPQYASGPYGQPPARTSVTAVLSLVLGLLGCIPFVTGLSAVVLGIVGIRATTNPSITGRGLAIAGLSLGILSILFWGGLIGTARWFYVQSAPDRARARTFITELSSGNATAAKAMCSTSISNAQIDAAVAKLQSAGALQSVRTIGFNAARVDGSTSTIVGGAAIFANGRSMQVVITFGRSGGNSLIEDFRIK